MPRKVISVVFGSKRDLDHVQNVTRELKARGWLYFDWYDYNPLGERNYAVTAGSVHRDPILTLEDMSQFCYRAREAGDRLIFLTCIGLRDEASGGISSYTGKRVVAVPPDVKDYEPRYPNGLRVYPFSKEPDREKDIIKAMDWIEGEFDDPDWDLEDAENLLNRDGARDALRDLRLKIQRGELQL